MDGLMNRLRNLDAYPKINEDFYSRTLSGGVITLASSVVMILLFLSEPRLYLHAATETKLVVDTSRGETLRINFDVTFPALPCSILSLDAMDISGEQHLDIRHDIIKKRIDSHGNVIEARQEGIGAPKIEKPLQRRGGRLEHNETYCGSCYGAESTDEECCNNCEEVREAYRKKGWVLANPDLVDQCKREGFLQRIKDEEGEGCNVYGFLEVNKVAGNFHFAPGKSFQQSNVHVHDLVGFQKDSFNLSHHINRLAFGDYFPGVVNPLDNVQWAQKTPNGMYQYFIKVVPTVYTDVSGYTIQSNQFLVTEHLRSAEVGNLQFLPGVFFFYDLSPIKMPKNTLWDDEKTAHFLELVAESFSRKTSKTPSTPMYQQWAAKMCERYGSDEYSVLGLRTKYQRMKKRYRIYLRVSTNTGIGWDEESQTCLAPPEIIKDFAQGCGETEKICHEGLANHHLYKPVFSRTVATGFYATASGGNRPPSTQMPFDEFDEEIEVDPEPDLSELLGSQSGDKRASTSRQKAKQSRKKKGKMQQSVDETFRAIWPW